MKNEIQKNEDRSRFEIKLDPEYAFIDYRWFKGDLVLMHTFVPEEGRGKGIADALAKFALDYALEQNLKVVVYCPFVLKYLQRHSDYQDLVRT